MNSNAALRVAGVRRAFGDREVLRGVSLEVRPAEFVALMGRSGCGKTTLLRVVADLDREASGTVELPERVGVGFQDTRLLPWKRVAANVGLGLVASASDVRSRVAEALGDVGLTSLARAWPATLSGGEAARVALARALVRRPELLLLDEPFGSLDALTRMQMHALLGEMCAKYGPSVLMVTHDVEEALVLADRIVIMEDGVLSHELIVDLPMPRDRTSAPFQALRAALLGKLGVSDALD